MLPPHYSPYFSGHSGVFKKEAGDLPHWTQTDKLQFITFRLRDSLPQEVIEVLKVEKEHFEKRFPKPWDKATQQKFAERFHSSAEKYLDAGYGSCLLQHSTAREILEDVIRYNDGVLYSLLAFVIMPNHVHILIFHQDKSIDEVIQNIKSISSHKINKALERTGAIWMPNYFDRIIRTRQHLFSTIHYIEDNPRNLPPHTYTLYINTESLQQF